MTKNEKLILELIKKYNSTREEIIQIAKEKNINVYISNTQQIKPQLNLFISKMNNWIVWTNECYFNASKGMDYFYFNLGIEDKAEAIPMKKLYDHFYRPDLIKLKLAGEEEAYQEVIGKLDLQEALNNPPPIVKIKKIDKETSKEKTQVSFSIAENYNSDGNSGGVGLIRIYQEGKLVQTIGEGEVKRQSANIDTILAQNRLNNKQKKEQKIYMASTKESSSKKTAPKPVGAYVPKNKIDTTTNQGLPNKQNQ